MNTKVWYLPYFEGVYRTRMIETFSYANARMVCMVHTMPMIVRGDLHALLYYLFSLRRRHNSCLKCVALSKGHY